MGSVSFEGVDVVAPAAEYDPPLDICPFCGSASLRLHARDYRGVTISRCCDCGVKFMNPQYTDDCLSKFYSQYISFDRPFGQEPEFVGIEYQRREENFERIERQVGVGRLLSIGCGAGVELQVGQRRGWTVEGYDVDPETTCKLSRKLSIPVHTGDLCRLGLPAHSYDCVYLDQVLEHPKQPQHCLREAHRLLRPGGVIFLACPNIMSLAAATKSVLERLGLRRRRCGRYYNTEHHLFYYSPGVLRRILERWFGFQVCWVQGDPLIRNTHVTPLQSLLYKRLPWLDSTFRLMAAKAA